jgi:alpha-beta hydrolase superfamily lysophospholipase
VDPVRTSLLIHGTWARAQSWWRSGGDFHGFVHGQVWPDLYSGSDAFAWRGGYSDEARDVAARQMIDWVAAHQGTAPRLMAHSHGGSVSMLATHLGMTVPHLVLLSCPVHTRYLPAFGRVQKTTSIRVHLDLIILADRGGQRFHDSRIDEHVLPRWFHHSCTHDPAVWVSHGVASWL